MGMMRRNIDTTAQVRASLELAKMNKRAAQQAVPPVPVLGPSQMLILEQRVAALEAQVQWCMDAIQQLAGEPAED